MAVSVQFEDQLVVWTFEGSWTWDEYFAHQKNVNRAIEAANYPVDMIIDMRNSKLLPKNILTNGSRAAQSAPSNMGKTIFVGSSAVLQMFFRLFNQVYTAMPVGKTLKFSMVATLDEAYALLGQSSGRAI